MTLLPRRLVLLLGLALLAGSCSSPSASVCSVASAVSSDCGGYMVTSSDTQACESRVSVACSTTEQTSYMAFLTCDDDRCLDFSPEREVAVSCDSLLSTVSSSCYAAGVVGNSAYRYCANGSDECLSTYGYACSKSSGTCTKN